MRGRAPRTTLRDDRSRQPARCGMPESSFTPSPPSSPEEVSQPHSPTAREGAPAPPDKPAVTPWREALLNNLKTFAASAGLLAGVWVVAFLVLHYFAEYSSKDAIGF